MKRAIIIGTSFARGDQADACFKSCKNSMYEVDVICNDKFELAHIALAHRKGYDEFLYLHDTCIVKDVRLFDLAFNIHKGYTLSLADHPCIMGMYLGKYRKEVLDKIIIPTVETKQEAVHYEMEWTKYYLTNETNPIRVIDYPLHDGHNFVTMYGKLCMKLENDLLIKYKTTWNRSMVK